MSLFVQLASDLLEYFIILQLCIIRSIFCCTECLTFNILIQYLHGCQCKLRFSIGLNKPTCKTNLDAYYEYLKRNMNRSCKVSFLYGIESILHATFKEWSPHSNPFPALSRTTRPMSLVFGSYHKTCT